MSAPKKIAILGAGITGLSLAWHLQKYTQKPLKITIFEESSRVGGMVHTLTTEAGLFELGPHTIRLSYPYKEACLNLMKDLDLENEVLVPQDSVKKRYIGYDGNLHPFPMHPLKLLSFKNIKNILIPLLKESSKPHLDLEDPSIDEFISHRFNSYIRDYFVDPMVSGIFGGDLKKLSLKSCFPLLYELKNKQGSLIKCLLKHKKRHPAQMISFKKGLSSLPLVIAEKLKTKMFLKTQVKALHWNPKPIVVFKGHSLEVDHLFSCLPAHSLHSLLSAQNLSQLNFLSNLDYVSFKVLHLAFHKSTKILDAFGFLTPSFKNEKLAGVIFDSALFPEHNNSDHSNRLTVLIHEKSRIYNLIERELILEVLIELERYFKCSMQPEYQRVYVVKKAIAQYEVGHEKRLQLFTEELNRKLPGFSFTGSSFYGASVPSCIYQGQKLAKDYCLAKKVAN